MPTLYHAPELAPLLSGDLPCWLVLDRLPDTLKRLYELEEAPQYVPLYARTRYADCLAQSPLLVRVSDALPPLWQTFVNGHGEAPLRGVIVTSQASTAEVVAHLRSRLETRFYGQRRGLLRFYDPWIAAHLFSHAVSDSAWLGPLQRVVWHGGTFEQRAEVGAQWYALSATDAPTSLAVPDDEMPLGLAPAQETAMERYATRWPLWRQRVERHGLREDSREQARLFVTACEEAERLALPREQWPDYLTWRFEAPEATWPEGIVDTPAERRLARLQRHIESKKASLPADRWNEDGDTSRDKADDAGTDVLALLGTFAGDKE
ncbi:hypothetical protein L861_12650 [Litchfieldella anticariensis FP35 = DSM 16096]|uniref:DUF4123 domain-containing protein n=1 Tax=Litchfieldella anticariensis (strain DSM 16096 / CECT 5854 / CIP 108499 / LMG 22089 / FP35) TaxID=1121939 RepID=S2L7C2_LITA3|nr:DUF4123 domain-containing protein [Halomonas anticariensis]EPC00636.1 hypothetical protein L861_12650 [Halomonas anticariensis FP35 = DSM 16096]